jgi:N-acetylglucosamine-6-sulfatase
MYLQSFRSAMSTALLLVSLALPIAIAAQQGGAPQGGAPAAAPQGGRGGGTPAPLPPATQATEPSPQFLARHEGFLEIARRGNIDLLWIGDSITDWWARSGTATWDQYFAPLRPANFGIAGDRTQGVLWRMQNGELEGFQAKLIVLMLGTNNINRNPNAEIAQGVAAIVREFRTRQPQAKVLVLGVFPRGAAADNPFRTAIREINADLARLDDGQNVFYMDIGNHFLAADGTLPTDVMGDGLHPNANGYRIWGEAINGRVRELMGMPVQ